MTPEWDEPAARRHKFEQILAAQAADPARAASLPKIKADRAARRPLAVDILGAFLAGARLDVFRADLQTWAAQNPERLFGGISGVGFLHSLVLRSADPVELGEVLRSSLRVPSGLDEAAAAIGRLAEHAESVKQGPSPAPRHASFFCSFLWQQQDQSIPCAWTSAVKMAKALAWLDDGLEPGAEYAAYASLVESLGVPAADAEHAFAWFEQNPWVGLDPGLRDRIARATALGDSRVDGQYLSPEDEAEAGRHARQLVAELALLGSAVADRVADALGRSVSVNKPGLLFAPGCFRNDTWVQWSLRTLAPKPQTLASLVAWVTPTGTMVGVQQPYGEPGRAEKVAARLLDLPLGDLRLYRVTTGAERVVPEPVLTPIGSWVFGRWFPDDAAVDRVSFADDVICLAAELQPAMDVLVEAATASLRQDVPHLLPPTPADNRLARLVDEFRAHGYPTPSDDAHRAARVAMAEALAQENLVLNDIAGLQKVFNSVRYRGPGPAPVLNTTLREADPVERGEIFEAITDLVYGDDPVDVRLDRLLGESRVKGLHESIALKFLAVAHPDRFIPVYPYTGANGKARMLQALGIPSLPPALTRGTLHVRANDLLRERLAPFFADDAWGMSRFLYWLADRGGIDVVPVEQPDPLPALAAELLVSEVFLRDIVELLDEKRQVVFYGPPGTGKTYVARKLAELLAGDPSRSMIVQFHPSTSYEDFFEGYRPEEAANGELVYRRVPGPLAVLADRALQNPSREHVLVIDEINRANLPKVFGELLNLLEYRGDEVRTLYRPDEPFVLPPNLKIIATMNTVDRSIALVDAALRRRFHFVPFFPNDGEMAGLLGRWFDARHPKARWVADLVDQVNTLLAEKLGGNDLQIGPSYFMSEKLDDKALQRIWKYSIHPLIADVLFGRPQDIQEFAFEQVMRTYQASTKAAAAPEPGLEEA